jgi:uncharacterized protein (DUF302 family)
MKKLRSLFIYGLCVALLCWIAGMRSPAVAGAVETESAVAANGLVQVTSNFAVAETGDRLEALLAERQFTLFARIDHAENAASVDKELRDTELFIFGNPNVGTLLMQCNQSVAIDLPQKILIWEDESGQTWLAYNDPAYLMARHSLSECGPVSDRISQVLADIARLTTQES